MAEFYYGRSSNKIKIQLITNQLTNRIQLIKSKLIVSCGKWRFSVNLGQETLELL